jgi:hypothetical protein
MRLEPTFAIALAALSGCCGGAPAKGDEVVSRGPVTIAIEAPERLPYGAAAKASATLENRGEGPIAVTHFSLEAGADPVARAPEPSSFEAAPSAGGRLLAEGWLMVEDIGPAARLPEPPRWEWAEPRPATRATTLAVLAPGEKLRCEGSFHATDALGGALRASARFVAVDPAALYRTVECSLEPLAPGAPTPASPAGHWRAAARTRVVFAPAGGAAPSNGAAPLSWTVPADFFTLGNRPPPNVFPYALLGKAALEEEAHAKKAVFVERPSFDLDAARKKAGVPSGGSAYYAPGGAWFLESHGKTVFVSPEKRIEVRGDARALGAALGDADRATVTIFSWAPSDDPDGLATRFRAKGFEVNARMEKGMTYRGTVEVARDRLVSFLEEVAAAGLTFEGLSLSKRAP